jgi:hypothetical protein
MDSRVVLQDTEKLKELLEKGLIQANDEYNFFVNESAPDLYKFYDENVDDAIVAYEYFEQVNNDINDSIKNLEDCRTIANKAINVVVESHKELNKKKLEVPLQFITKKYIEDNKNKFKRRDRNDKQIQTIMKLIDRETKHRGTNKEGGNRKTKKRSLGRKKKTHSKR